MSQVEIDGHCKSSSVFVLDENCQQRCDKTVRKLPEELETVQRQVRHVLAHIDRVAYLAWRRGGVGGIDRPGVTSARLGSGRRK